MRQIKKGSTDKSVVIRIIDSTAGTPEEGVTYATSGLDLWYRREGGAVVSLTEATLAAVDSAHSDGGIIHIGNGYYRLDLPDAAFATGASSLMIGGTVTGMIVIGTEIQLVNYDPEDGVRLGLTALPNAAADAAGGLPVSDAGSLDLDTLLARLDAAISTRLATAGYTAPDNTGIGEANAHAHAIDTRLPSDPADESALEAAVAGLASLIADVAVPGDAMALTSDERVAIFARTLDGLSIDSILKTLLSHAVGKLNGAPGGPLNFRDVGDTKNVITLTADANGNRTSVTLNP